MGPRIRDHSALTEREIEVLEALVSLDDDAEETVAHHLGISPKTVAAHLTNIRQKREVRSRAALVADALRNNLVIAMPRRPIGRTRPLTPTEQRILDMLISLPDTSNRAIAEAVGLSPNTVTTHINSIFTKRGVHTRSGLIADVFRTCGAGLAYDATMYEVAGR